MATPLTASRAPRDPYTARPPKCEDCGIKVSPSNWSGLRVHNSRWLCTVAGGNRPESCYDKSIRRAVEDLQSERRREVDIWVSDPPAGLHSLHDSVHYTGKRFVHGMLDEQGVPAMKPRAVEHLNRVEYDSRPKEVSMVRRVLSVPQCARIAGKGETAIRDAIARGDLVAGRSGGERTGWYEVRPADFLAWLGRLGWNEEELGAAREAVESCFSSQADKSA